MKMKEKMKKAVIRSGPVLASLALKMGIFTANASSCFAVYQPKEPEGMAKYKK
mgnify:CR=1 FL=1